MRRSESLTWFLQAVGRGLRSAPGKEDCLILDHAGNRHLHGLPDDERVWTLDGHKSEGDTPLRRCLQCFSVCHSGCPVCPECGFRFPAARQARDVLQVEGDLEEVRIEQERRDARAAQALANSLEALTELGRLRGYKDPDGWARHVYNARLRKRGRKAA